MDVDRRERRRLCQEALEQLGGEEEPEHQSVLRAFAEREQGALLGVLAPLADAEQVALREAFAALARG